MDLFKSIYYNNSSPDVHDTFMFNSIQLGILTVCALLFMFFCHHVQTVISPLWKLNLIYNRHTTHYWLLTFAIDE